MAEFPHPFSPSRIGSPTFETGETMRDSTPPLAAYREAIAPKVKWFLDAVSEAWWIKEGHKGDLNQALESVSIWLWALHRTTATSGHLITPPEYEAAHMFFDDIGRLEEVLRSDDTRLEEEYWLLYDAVHGTPWKIGEDYPYFDHPISVYDLAGALVGIRGYALLFSQFPLPGLPSTRFERTARLIWENYHGCHFNMQQLFQHNVDRWIHPRLGLNPEQWTSRVERTVRRLNRTLTRPNEWYVRELPVSPEISARVRELCGELDEFVEELLSLRFDSVREPVTVCGASGKRVCRLDADIDAKTVWLDGKGYPVPKLAAIFVRAVINSGNDYISGTQIHEQYGEFEHYRVNRARQQLERSAKEVLALIDTTGTGSRLKPEAWKPRSQS